MRRTVSLLLLLISVVSYGQEDAAIGNGYAKYRELNTDIYLAALFLPTPTKDTPSILRQTSKRLEIKIIASNFSYRRFARSFVKSSAINNRSTLLVDNAKAMEDFLGWFKGNLKQGDHIVLDGSDRGFTLSINGVQLATIDSPRLLDMLLNTWIGDVPPSREFKARIQGGQQAMEYRDQFEQLRFNPARVAVVRGWKKTQKRKQSAAAAAALAQAKPVIAAPKIKAPTLENLATPVPTPDAQLAAQSAVSAPQTSVSETDNPQPDNDAAAQSAGATLALTTAADTLADEVGEAEDEIADEFSAENLLAVQLYVNNLLIHSQRKIAYPNISRRLGHTGTVIASVTINRQGRLQSYDLTGPSKYAPLNAAVSKGIKRSAPYPQVPDTISGESFTFQVPVKFTLAE